MSRTTPQQTIASRNMLLRFLILNLFLLPIAGCGTGSLSKNDLSRYAISRGGDDDEEEEEQPAPQKPKPADPTPKASGRPTLGSTQPEEEKVAEEKPEEVDYGPTAHPVIAGVKHIEDRKPDGELSQSDRRTRSAENIHAIAGAMLEWLNSSGQVQTNNIRDSLGRPGLSWRVRLLPFLGYQELYEKFDLKESWDGPTNKPLLKYIPDEFVSPERFDEYTNYQMFVNGMALFSERRVKERSDISDEPRVLLVCEFDDPVAVPWTSPYDYDFTEEPLDRGLGNLRDDGIFVGWMTGKAGLWPKPINLTELRAAITFEAGDYFQFLKYAVYPPALPGGSARPTLGGSTNQPTNTASLPTSNTGLNQVIVAPSARITSGVLEGITRIPVPPRDEIVAAEGRIGETYGAAFQGARVPAEFATLAKTIYQQLTGGARQANNNDDDDDDGNTQMIRAVTVPPPELFVGLRSALNLSIRGQDTAFALQLLNEMDARFEIDRRIYETNLLLGFLGKEGSMRTNMTKASNLLPMMEGLVNSYIQDDDFEKADENLGYAAPAVKAFNNPETTYRWRILHERIEAGKRQFRRVSRHIETLRQNPENIEANHAVGWYLCMVKGNWADGSGHLAKSSDVELRALALQEVQTNTDINRHVSLGDGWWNYAAQHRDDQLVYEAAMNRSRYWYTSASIGLNDGLDRIRANNRIVEINRRIGDPPLGSLPTGY